MSSWRLRFFNRLLPIILKFPLTHLKRPTPLTRKIESLAHLVLRRPRGVTYEDVVLPNGRSGIWCHPDEVEDNNALLYLHGGGYIMGCPATHLPIAANLALRIKRSVLLPDYRLAPEHPFPAALDDAADAYDFLAAQGHPKVAVAGDSAGGGLSFALLHDLFARGKAPPACVVGFSPWTDLSGGSESLTRNAPTEVSLPVTRIAQAAAWYAGDTPLTDPRISPVFGRFDGAGPALLQVSKVEALEDDTTRLAEKLRADGVEVIVQTWETCPHAWPVFAGRFPEADDALDRAGKFIARELSD